MTRLPARTDAAPVSPPLNLEFIRAAAEAHQNGGHEEITTFHRALFLHEHGRDLERFRQQCRIHEDRIASLDARLQTVRGKLQAEENLVPVLENGMPDTQPSAPWHLWDRVMFGAAAAAIACLLLFGIFNISFNLLESGIVTFTAHPIRAYFWAALLPVGALAVKVGWDFLQDRRRRDIYVWSCLALGVAGVIVWLAAYAAIYPSLSRTAEEQLQSLSVFDAPPGTTDYLSSLTSGGAKRIDMILVGAQAIAEVCLSAVLGIYLTQLYAKHRPVRLVRNPVFAQLDDERSSLEESLSQERLALADARGSESRLEHQLAVFVACAQSLFQKEAALRRDRNHQKRLVFEEVTQQLRARLESGDRELEPGHNGDHPVLALGREEAR